MTSLSVFVFTNIDTDMDHLATTNHSELLFYHMRSIMDNTIMVVGILSVLLAMRTTSPTACVINFYRPVDKLIIQELIQLVNIPLLLQ